VIVIKKDFMLIQKPHCSVSYNQLFCD